MQPFGSLSRCSSSSNWCPQVQSRKTASHSNHFQASVRAQLHIRHTTVAQLVIITL